MTIQYAEILRRLNTAPLQRSDGTATVSLVVFNEGDEPYTGPVSFAASFPVRAEKGAQPVTVFAENGAVVPSRLTESRLEARLDLPPARVHWTLTLQFYAADVPAHGWQAYGATFAASPESRSDDAALWESANGLPPSPRILVRETNCHAGDLPLRGTYGIL